MIQSWRLDDRILLPCVINFPVARAAILVFRGRTYLRCEPYVIRHLDVTWTSGSIPQWIEVPAFRRSVNRLMDFRLLDAISHERSDTGSTRRKQYVRWFGGSVDFLARKEKELVPLRFASALSTGLKWFWWGAS
ncbi:hypothetical protein MTP99_009191 [Tenebrio molitor]|nr:hypothetical protein MTP99_009191 [Tenebrio molitor]